MREVVQSHKASEWQSYTQLHTYTTAQQPPNKQGSSSRAAKGQPSRLVIKSKAENTVCATSLLAGGKK